MSKNDTDKMSENTMEALAKHFFKKEGKKRGRPLGKPMQIAKMTNTIMGTAEEGCRRTKRRHANSLMGQILATKVYKEKMGVEPNDLSDVGYFFYKHGKPNHGYFEKLGLLEQKLGENWASEIHRHAVKLTQNLDTRGEKYTTEDIWGTSFAVVYCKKH